MYTAVDLSKYIVNKCIADSHPISNLQLQKILYYIQVEFLRRGQPAFRDPIEAWQFGPVVPNAYYYFCGFGAMRITECYNGAAQPLGEDKNIIDEIVLEKSAMNPWQVVADTHKPGGAWDRIYRDGEGNHQIIPLAIISELE